MKLANFFTFFNTTLAAVAFSASDQVEFNYKMDQQEKLDNITDSVMLNSFKLDQVKSLKLIVSLTVFSGRGVIGDVGKTNPSISKYRFQSL